MGNDQGTTSSSSKSTSKNIQINRKSIENVRKLSGTLQGNLIICLLPGFCYKQLFQIISETGKILETLTSTTYCYLVKYFGLSELLEDGSAIVVTTCISNL